MSATAYAVLLRGINLGPSHKVPMAQLRTLLTDAGYTGVRTLLNSGNAVLGSTRAAGATERHVEALLEKEFGFAVPTMVRTAGELDDVLSGTPFPEADAEPKGYHVLFLSKAPAASVLSALTPVEEPFAYAVRGREVYVHSPQFTDSPVWALLTEKRLGVRTTARTWQTVTKLRALLV